VLIGLQLILDADNGEISHLLKFAAHRLTLVSDPKTESPDLKSP
jgi:hypothetical protein